jgi:hypothetical protein
MRSQDKPPIHKLLNMSLVRSMLIKMKIDLVSARILVQVTTASARRAGDLELSNRLRRIADHLAAELDYLENLLANCTE